MIGSLSLQRSNKERCYPKSVWAIFWICCTSVFFLAPFTGKIINKVGLGSAFKFNFFSLYGMFAFSYGFLTYINNTEVFLALAYFLRITQGCFGTIVWSLVLSILLAWYSSKNTFIKLHLNCQLIKYTEFGIFTTFIYIVKYYRKIWYYCIK